MQQANSSPIYRKLNLQEDLLPLVNLLQEIEQVDQAGEQVTEDSLREQLTWSGQDPALNNWVVALPDSASLVGYGLLQKTPNDPNADLSIMVHPTWRRQGIGSKLLAHLLERAGELDAQALRAYVPIQNKGASVFVQAQKFEPVSSYVRLSMANIQPFAAPDLPRGFTIRSYDQVKRVDIYTEALNRSYEGYWGHLQCTEEDMVRFLPHLNPTGIFLLFAPDGSIAGTCRATLSEQEGEVRTALIDAPGIVAEYRESDMELQLLLTAIDWLLPQHPTTLELEAWGEAPQTLASYRDLGFSSVKEEISYRRNLE